MLRCISFDPYIKPQHRYDTIAYEAGCISFDPYIKPQLKTFLPFTLISCISFDPYIKPQLLTFLWLLLLVVYLLIPTSNHNCQPVFSRFVMLYIFWSLHQTTTIKNFFVGRSALYIFWSLHQTTTKYVLSDGSKQLYIFWSLHQTTTYYGKRHLRFRCISFDPYIKPQLIMVKSLCLKSCISFDPYIKPQQRSCL